MAKKLDYRNTKFRITKIIFLNAVQLDVFWREKSFNINLIRPAASDPFPSQNTNDTKLFSLIVHKENNEERYKKYVIEEVFDKY